ncbi:hypothetical protein JO972_16690 [Verrucomicrobiaceae bacterium 5K15]|uniref:Uncharacterized protein n=1 Tax=Oceaniferula flava TaxID=2800421 RepID=A0AAE2VF47_9BACT|nr:hypothetical protein [Oceaniferula flavus]MBK1856604.1 hypothetical protein [Oceaniferula flavus]MBM1137912.1 hypothetical protein [Oceaniferula flavus]
MNEDNTNIIMRATGLILQVISMFPRNKREQTKDQEEALSSLSRAYHATEAYYDFRKDNPRNKDREWNVAEGWDQVSILMKKYDANLSNRLSLKSRCWREGDNWTKQAIADAKIGLSQIRAEVSIRLQE